MSLLPLDTWAEIMGFNRWHFWGFADNDLLSTANQHCSEVMFEDAPQSSDGVGRSDIRLALENAEDLLYRYASFYPAPRFYEVDRSWGKLADKRFHRSRQSNADGRWKSIVLQDTWIQDAGIEGLTFVQLDVPVTLVDVNGDSYPEYFQLGPISTTVTDPKEIAVYFGQSDRWDGSAIGERWRVEPLQVTISGGQLTIRGKPWLVGRPVLSQGIEPAWINAKDPASFASGLDVYRRFVDRTGTLTTNSQAVIYWETRPCHGWWCCCGGTCCSCVTQPFSGAIFDPASFASATARVAIRDGRRGVVAPAEAFFNATTQQWEGFPITVCWEPDRVKLRLYAGFPLDTDGLMDRKMRPVVARLAAAEMQQEICGCAEAKRRVFHWQMDLSKVGADKNVFAISASQLDNPLGTRRGHWWAWNAIEDLGRMKGRIAG